jgi:hypothetical protein
MEIAWVMGIFFTFVTIIFIAVAIFLPEWVGITGKKAQAIIKEHQGDSSPGSAGQNGNSNNTGA